MTSPFDTVLANIRRLRPDLNFQPTAIVPQIRPTSIKLKYERKTPVKLLVGPISLPITYTKAGQPYKRQPKPCEIGDMVYVWCRLHDGLLALYPFEMAGQGYELVIDAEEGVHFRFFDPGEGIGPYFLMHHV